jgi:hypothetical protein
MEGKSLPSRAAVEEECWVRMSIGTSNGLETCTTGARTLQRSSYSSASSAPWAKHAVSWTALQFPGLHRRLRTLTSV